MYTYIVVDDEKLTRKGTIKKLEPLGDVISCCGEAENGEEALKLIEVQDPDIIITDMNMPVLSGSQLLPIITSRYPDKRIIVISGYKDFEYMKQAITAQAVDYIVKPFSRETLQTAVQNALKMIESTFSLQAQLLSNSEEKEMARYEYDCQLLKNLILGHQSGDASITSEKLKFISRTHCLVLITIYSLDSLDEAAIQNFLSEHGFGDLALYLKHLYNDYLGFLVLFIPEQSAVEVADLCRQILQTLEILLSMKNCTASFGISGIHNDLLSLHEAFLETIRALNDMDIGSKRGVYFYQDISDTTHSFVWDKQDLFLFRVEAGTAEEIKELLDELFESFYTIPDFRLSDVKFFCLRLTESTKGFVEHYFNYVNASTSPNVQNLLNNMFSMEEVHDYFLHFFKNINAMLRERNEYSQKNVIDKMKLYINRNYQKNLTLDYLSELFYLNRSYCSHLFKEKTGEGFSNYLNRIRIEHAKHLLLESDKKMYQVAKAVGYDNVKYFFRIFRKFTGTTPEEFRRNG